MTCPKCGANVQPQTRRSGPPKIYCSRACKESALQLRRSARVDQAAVASARLQERHRRRARETTCRICRAVFCPMFGRQSARLTCSDECSAENDRRMRCRKQSARKARSRGVVSEQVDALEVFEAYRWQCAACRCSTPRSLRGSPHLRAPELDHIVPIAKGGAHVRSNVQLLCRGCNRAKSMSLTHLI